MRLRRLLPLAIWAIATVAAPVVSAADPIPWRKTFDEAVEEAKRDGKPIFVAINMDGERANDEAVNVLYRDATIKKLAANTAWP